MSPPHGEPGGWELSFAVSDHRLAARWAWLGVGGRYIPLLTTTIGHFQFVIEVPCATPSWLPHPCQHGHHPNLDRPLEVASERDLLGRTESSVTADRGHYIDQSRQVRRDLATARRHLAAESALPWAAFPEGRLPAMWWRHLEFVEAISGWAWRR